MRGPRGIPLTVRAEAIARVEAGEARRRVAREIGVNEATIRGWERNTRNPPPGSMQARVRQSADDLSREIQAAQTECRLILIERLRDELPTAKARPAELATVYGILSDKDHRYQEARARARTEGEAQALETLGRDVLLDRLAQLKSARGSQ
jgi:transcriptional regulator with XRE-family HTH domain